LDTIRPDIWEFELRWFVDLSIHIIILYRNR